jgi:hypothetical protein
MTEERPIRQATNVLIQNPGIMEATRFLTLRNAYEITSRFDCALGHATCLLGCSENSKGNAAWAITGKT